MNLFDTIKLGRLLGKYISGTESSQESGEIIDWLKESSEHEEILEKLRDEKDIADSIEEFDHFNKDLAWKRYLENIKARALRKRLFQWKVAAVFFLLIGLGSLLAYFIDVDKSSLLSKEGYTTVVAGNGQHSKIVLPDSSVVWINSGSTLSYNNNFAVNTRKVKLTGQAYFKVTHNTKIPLVVSVDGLKINVLGTSFDVSAYPQDQNVSVVLESGSVEMTHSRIKSFKYRLKPGEKAVFNNESKELLVAKVNTYKFTSWKDGVLIFKDDPMYEVFEKLERWYNIKIEVQDESIKQKVFNATIVNESMKEIFDLIQFTCAVNYKVISSDNPNIPVKVIVSEN